MPIMRTFYFWIGCRKNINVVTQVFQLLGQNLRACANTGYLWKIGVGKKSNIHAFIILLSKKKTRRPSFN